MATADRPGWRTSSFSTSNGQCVEVDPGAAWRTSSFSTDNGQCVEVDPGPGTVRVRDTKDRGHGPVLTIDPATWAALRRAALHGDPLDGPLVIATDSRETVHDGGPRTTTWHVTHDATTLHFTNAERVAFAQGVRAGEFSFVAAWARQRSPKGLRQRRLNITV